MSEKRKQRGFTELTPAQQAAIVDGAYGFVRGTIAPYHDLHLPAEGSDNSASRQIRSTAESPGWDYVFAAYKRLVMEERAAGSVEVTMCKHLPAGPWDNELYHWFMSEPSVFFLCPACTQRLYHFF